MWSSGQNSWQQIQRSGLDSWHYQIFWEVVGLKQGPLSLVSIIEELLGSSSSSLESREYGRRNPSCWPRGTLYPQKLVLTSPTSGSRLVGIFPSRTLATEFFLLISISEECMSWITNTAIYWPQKTSYKNAFFSHNHILELLEPFQFYMAEYLTF
jgi:hypothetical protein